DSASHPSRPRPARHHGSRHGMHAAGSGRPRFTARSRRPPTAHRRPPTVSFRAPPRQRPPPHERRRERRGLLEPRRAPARPPEQARRLRLRPAVRDARRRLGRAPRVDRNGEDHLRLLLRRRPARAVRLHTRRRAQLPRPPRPVEGLRVGARPVRHLHGARRRLRPAPPHELRHVHRRGHRVARRAHDRVHLAQGRGPRHLHDGRRRVERAAPHDDAGLRRRPLLLPRRPPDRLPRPPPHRLRGARRLPGPPRPAARAAQPHGDLGDERRRLGAAAGDQPRRRQLRPVLHPRRPPHHLLVQPQEPAQPQLRPLPRGRRRRRARGRDHRPRVRRLPDVQPRRHEARLGVEPRGRGAGRDERVRGGLEGV
ncbi:MAG: tolB protein precursor, periplasmic protein involved in the tonb-independent uptake of group A colicins, partial [uncultured Gemmatimonadaceae bacterium]